MKIFFHEDFYQVYSTDPAAQPGRMEAVVGALRYFRRRMQSQGLGGNAAVFLDGTAGENNS